MNKDKLSKAIGNSPEANSTVTWSNNLKRGRVPGPRMKENKMLPDTLGGSTMSVHAGTYEDPITGAVGTPIFQSSTFHFSKHTYDSFAQGLIRDIPTYTRYGNPTVWSVQEKISQLENAESTILFSSGMSAITTTLVALTNRGGHVISSYDVYGGTYNFLREDIHQLGREATFVDGTDVAAVEAAIKVNTQVLFFETLSNPLLKALPLRELIALAKARNLLLVVDNTFLSPICLRPVEEGADIVLHSCSKYMNGHSDLIAGSVSGSRKYVDRIWSQMLKFGGNVNPLSAFLLERGLKTLALRMQAHVSNAGLVASFLASHPKVGRVYHPSLPGYEYPWINNYCANGFGGMVSFEVKGGNEAALALLTHLKIPLVATSLGGVESLVSLPFNTSHSFLTEKQREEVGIMPGLVRLSVGVENFKDLRDDFEAALGRI